MKLLKLACIQTNTSNVLENNQAEVEALIRQAASNGATFILTPEYTLMMDSSGRVMRENALPADGGLPLAHFKALAGELGIWLLIGSLTLKAFDPLMSNRSFLIDDKGVEVGQYDKIHLFDVTLPDGRQIRESAAYRPGNRLGLVNSPWGQIGMTICYDLRFPALFRALAQAGAQIITVPSSFQQSTGKAHWHVLLQARAIENACFIVAPAMCGEHAGGRKTFGHSLVVNPWGEIVVDGGETPGIVYAEIDIERVEKTRNQLPSLAHDRAFNK